MASLVDGKVRVVAALRGVLSPAGIPWTAQRGFVARAVWKKVKSDLVRATSKDGLIGRWGEVAAGDVVRGDVFWWVAANSRAKLVRVEMLR